MTFAQKIIENKQERANVYEHIKTITNEFENKEMDSIKKDELTKLESKFDALNESIIKNEKNLERERIVGENQKSADKAPKIGKEAEISNAFKDYLRQATPSTMEICNALQQANPTQAGYLVAPQDFMSELIEEKNNITFMRQVSRVLPALEKAQSMGFPKRTARMSTFAWGTEIQAPTADSSLAFGKREFMAKPATGGILVSKTLARNSAINIDSYLRGEMAYNQATNEETAYMTGTGSNQPLGVFTASADGISTSRDVSTGNTATEIKFDGLHEAKYSIKEQYQNGLTWAFHRDAVKKIAKLKTNEGQYIWQQSVVLNTPDMLMGYPVRMSEYAPNTFTTGLYVGILGNFKDGYWICDSLNMEIQALMELYALTNQIYYIGRHETDGMPVLDECFSRITLA